MSKPRKPKGPAPARGNFVSEWFGHRVYPTVTAQPNALKDQQALRCPFLSNAIGMTKECVKSATSLGVCDISSASNGPRQDWLVCPYRALDPALMEHVARRLFDTKPGTPIHVVPAPRLSDEATRARLTSALGHHETVIVYLQNKLGGEISLPSTNSSPEFSFDFTLARIEHDAAGPQVTQFGILELQTMDFHGSYKHAVGNLRDALRLHGADFPKVLRKRPDWLSDHIEGPNISNVFKRTFYQVMLKFEVARHPECAGCILALPASVWDSWQRHLGGPSLTPVGANRFELRQPTPSASPAANTWVLVFEVDANSQQSPNPVVVHREIRTDADSLSYYALKQAPERAFAAGGAAPGLLNTIATRIAEWWPVVRIGAMR